jgi:hypothetical protein
MTSVLKYYYSECSQWQVGHVRGGLFSRSEVEVAGIHSATNAVSCWMAHDGEKLHGSVSFLWLYAKHPTDLTKTAWKDRHSRTSCIPVLCCSSLPMDSVVLDFNHRHTSVAYRVGFRGSNPPPPPKFRSFDKFQSDCQLSGKCLVFLFQQPN